jgi:hypothetical protein
MERSVVTSGARRTVARLLSATPTWYAQLTEKLYDRSRYRDGANGAGRTSARIRILFAGSPIGEAERVLG